MIGLCVTPSQVLQGFTQFEIKEWSRAKPLFFMIANVLPT